MRGELFDRALHDHRRSLAGWAIGVGLYVALIVAFWPWIRDSQQLTTAFEDYPDALKELFGGTAGFDFASAGGFLNAELFSLVLPLLLSVFAIGFAAGVLAGEEERGLLDLVLAAPVRRGRLVAEKAAALLVGIGLLTVVAGGALFAVGLAVGLDAKTLDLVAALVGSALVAAVLGGLAFFAGAWRGNRAAAIGVGATVFGATYLLQVLASLVDGLAPLRWLSPMYLANGSVPALNGWPVWQFVVLVVVTAVLLGASMAVFERRDLAR